MTRPLLAGTTILEFGGGAAGPVATRYFADHGADRDPRRVAAAAGLPAHAQAHAEHARRARRRRALRGAERQQAARSRSTCRRPRAWPWRAASRSARRRRGRELRARRDGEVGARLRLAGPRAARPGHDQHVPQRPDRPAALLPGLRRPGIGALGLQSPHRLARPRARRPVRHHHRLALAALRRAAARDGAPPPPAHRPGPAHRPVAGRGRHRLPERVHRHLHRQRRGAGPPRQPLAARRTARRVPLRRRGRARALDRDRGTRRRRLAAPRPGARPAGLGARAGARHHRRAPRRTSTRSRRGSQEWTRSQHGRRARRRRLQAAGVEAAPVADLARPARRPAARAPRPLPRESSIPSWASIPRRRTPSASPPWSHACERRRPGSGEHTDAVLHDLLGMSGDEIGRLRESGVLE